MVPKGTSSSTYFQHLTSFRYLDKLDELGKIKKITPLGIPIYTCVENDNISNIRTRIDFVEPEPFYEVSSNIIREKLKNLEQRKSKY